MSINDAIMSGVYDDEYAIKCSEDCIKLYSDDGRRIILGQRYWDASEKEMDEMEKRMAGFSQKFEFDSDTFEELYDIISEYHEKQWTEKIEWVLEKREQIERLENLVLLALFREGRKDYVRNFLRNRTDYKKEREKLGKPQAWI